MFGSCSGYGISLENTNKSREHDSLVESAFASILISVEAISVASPTIGLNVLLPTLYCVPEECSWRANLDKQKGHQTRRARGGKKQKRR